MTYETILFEVEAGVATITLNRPERYNALTMTMYSEILNALKQCERNAEIRAVVLTGAGKAFSSGADLIELQASLGQFEISDVLRNGLNKIVLAMRALEKPIICGLNGVAAGAGAGLSLACDLRIASDKASYVFAAFVNIGIIPDAGTTYFLPQLVGVSKAFELAMFADGQNRLSAEQALALGVVNNVVAHESFASEVSAMAQKMAAMATTAVGLTKRAMYKSVERDLALAVEAEAQLQRATFRTQDFQEGVMAFIEKRNPEFKGK